MFAKYKRDVYRLTSNRILWWSLLILLLSIASVSRKEFKATYKEERGPKQIHEVVPFHSDSSIKFKTYHWDIITCKCWIYFDAFL